MDILDSLPDNWLELATAHAVTGWLKNSLQDLLPLLVTRQITDAEFAARIGSLFEDRKLTTLAQQKNPRSNTVQALKSFAPEHPAIALVSLSTEQYRSLNSEQRGRLAERETKYFTTDAAQTLVDRATSLLDSAEWSDVAAGLAVLIGRRISEILLSNFAPKTAWSILFSEMSKKPHLATGLEIEIPTLAPAQLILTATLRLQTVLRIEDLKLDSLTPKNAKQYVNQRYSEFVVKACQAHFANLIPNRSDRDNLYTHIFRACYATIAAHWFCPPNIPEYNYKAEIQGHFTLTPDGHKLPNYSARANYDDYAIGTPDGNRDGRLGIKLGSLPQLQVITAFQQPSNSLQLSTMDINIATIDKEINILIDMDEKSPAIDKEVDCTSDLGDRSPNPEVTSSTAPRFLNDAPVPLTPDDLPTVESAQTPSENATSAIAPIARKHKRPPLLVEDLERMTMLMAQQGVFGSPADLFHQLLDAFEQSQHQHQAQPQQGLEVIRWFTIEIDSLRATIDQLEQERDFLQASALPTDELESLKTENAQLKEQLQTTQSRLDSIYQLLEHSADATAPTPTASPTPVSTTLATSSPPPPSTAETPTTLSLAPKPAKPSRSPTETAQKINQIVDAMIRWNSSQQDHKRLIRISIPPVKALASALGANYQPTIQQVLKEREDELNQLHARLMLGFRHNATVPRKDELLAAIARDYLNLDNWSDVH